MCRPKHIIVISEAYRKLAENFYGYLLRLGFDARSSKSRYRYLCEFLSWSEQKGKFEITKITAGDIRNYYDYLSERPSKNGGGILSPKTTHGHMRNVRDLFMMLQNEGKIKINPCSGLKFGYPRETAERTVLTQSEIRTLYRATENALERAVLSMAYGCGLRVGELANCTTRDVRLREKLLIVSKGKGNKRRVVPMSRGVVNDLSDYYYNERAKLTKGRNYNECESAFMLNNRGGRMKAWTYNQHLKKMVGRINNQSVKVKQITIHNLRHSIATHLLEQGISVEQVRDFLGHDQLETTQIYTRINKRQLQELLQ